MTDQAQETKILKTFLPRDLAVRFVPRLAKERTRRKLLDRFHHFHDLDPRYATRIEPSEQNPERIYELLRARGAPDDCYVMSAMSDLDGQTVPLAEALSDVVGWCSGTFLSCIPGRLAYFEGEETNERYVLERRS